VFSSPLSDLCRAGSITDRKKGNIYESTDLPQKSNSTISGRVCARLFCAFALSASTTTEPDTGRRLSKQQHSRGDSSLFSLTTGTDNTAIGYQALQNNTTGNVNTAIGSDALANNTTGSTNIALGVSAGQNLTTGNNNIDIGNQGVAAESSTIRIGTTGVQTNTFIAGINGVDKSSGAPVFIDANGQLGTGSASPPGSVVMLPVSGGVAPPAPAGYVFKGFVLLTAKANGGGATTSYAVYTKS
jgi:hypothetical protein